MSFVEDIGLGQIDETVSSSVEAAADYLREQWARFEGLYSQIIDMQHRAAVVAYEATQAGNFQRRDMAKSIISALAELQRQHDRAVRTMAGIADTIGLRGYAVGLGVIPVAYTAAITGLALVVVWFFRATEAELQRLELLERGTITAEEFIALDPGPAPAMVLGQAAGLAKILLGGLVVYVVWQVARDTGLLQMAGRRARPKKNPPLVVFKSNPPGPIGREVVEIRYLHADDGEAYVHEFGPGVELYAEEDGTVTLEHRGGRELWREFEVD